MKPRPPTATTPTEPPPAPQTVRSLLDNHVAPLHRKIRAATLDELAAELSDREPEADLGGPERLISQVLRMKQVAEDKLVELGQLEQRWDDFTRRFYKRTDDPGRRQVLADYLTETTPDPVERRADLAALDRFLDYDAVRERHVIARHHLLVAIEIAITFIGSCGTAALEHAAGRGRERLAREMFDSGNVESFLHQVVETGARWQLRRAAIDGLVGFASCATGRDPAWLARLRAKHLGLAVRCATNLDDHPWVQGSAMRLVWLLSQDLCIDLVTKRLLDPPPNPRDFLVRRQCVELLASGDQRARDVLRRALMQHDPSEHVRQGIAEAFARMGALGELRTCAGLEHHQPEPSKRVRATAVQAACRYATTAQLPVIVEMVIAIIDRELDALPLLVACEDVAALIARSPITAELVEPLLGALLRLSSHPERAPAIQEAAAAAAERVGRALAFDGRAWSHFLDTMTRQIEPGHQRSIPLVQTADLPPLPSDPIFLGRILAELSRLDFPLFAERKGDRLIVWRGDRYRRRLWRILHEMRSRRPNKRQAHRHTVGRVMKGHLRAPPGGLEEVTATVVPGERTLVAEEGSWGRHLPTVDDMLDLPIASGDPVLVFSSHGVTTIRPPSSMWARLRNRLTLSLRYATVAGLRLASLAGTEPHTRQRYAEELRDRYGIVISFERYEYPRHKALAPDRLASLFAVAPVTEPQQRHGGPGRSTGSRRAIAPPPALDPGRSDGARGATPLEQQR